jgi:hypothetical protein
MKPDDLERIADLDRAIVRAVAFLRSRQLPHGEFATLVGADRTMANPAFDSSPFITSFVLYGLTHVDRAPVAEIVTRAASFLASQMEFGGVWRYWSSRQHKHCRLPPDLDDTACISYALTSAGVRLPKNDWAFLANRDSRGRFKTWLFPTSRNRGNLWFLFARSVGYCQARLRNAKVETPDAEDPRFRTMHINRDDVDPVVNANAVLYLGERPDTAPAIQFVIDTVLHEPSARSLYYEDPLALYYAVARAYRHSSPRLSVLAEPIVSRMLERGQDPARLNPLQAAMAASALLTFRPAASLDMRLLHLILAAQRGDGGWDAYPFYNVWGSEELTTGLCLEVLARAS